eukprot:GDKJ01015928.1.p1 GENE.GDKJ01015928.1~~GDKJ01015928.1.p1  ORF type:complete len:656 (-),score=124.37 GDKJ01015928.1:96-1868(-)
MINNHPDYVTTSCCSGRITIYRGGMTSRKIGGALLFVSHEPVAEHLFQNVEKCLDDGIPYYAAASTCMITPSEEVNAQHTKDKLPEAEITLKMEPFVIHIECASLLAARRLLSTASSLGFKNSGANTVGPKRVIVALRGSHRVEVPMRRATKAGEDGEIVPPSALPGLLRFCNEKMLLNSLNISTLFESIKNAIGVQDANSTFSNPKASLCCSCVDKSCDVSKDESCDPVAAGKKRGTPFEKVESSLINLRKSHPNVLSEQELEDLLRDVPTKKFEKLGDALIFHSLPSAWEKLLSLSEENAALIFSAVADSLKVRLLGTHGRVEGTTRIHSVKLLPSLNKNIDPWVIHKENGCSYCIKIGTLMFASGNGTERARMPNLMKEGEEIVDLFSGLGYFTLPMIMTKKAKRITACDINPIAHEGLKKGILSNKRSSGVDLSINGTRIGFVGMNGSLSSEQGKQQKDQEGVNRTIVEMYLGDSSLAGTEEGAGGLALFGRADRILLGLIPTSTVSWAAALRVINQTRGGIIHVHENAGSVEEVIEMVLKGFEEEKKKAGERCHNWSFEVENVERVKSYAPLVFHFVVDLRVIIP